jgi:mannose-1-phosphate guanylyltransferase
MLAQTVNRLEDLVPVANIFVITNVEQRNAVLESCPELLPERVIGEPEGRDTAAAVGLAALLVDQEEKDAAFVLLPADHVIENGEGFRSVLRSSFEAAEQNDYLVTIGIKPSFPSTGYGYLSQGDELDKVQNRSVSKVDRFVEKPNRVDIFGTRECLYGDHQLFSLRFKSMPQFFLMVCKNYWLIFNQLVL